MEVQNIHPSIVKGLISAITGWEGDNPNETASRYSDEEWDAITSAIIWLRGLERNG